MNIVKREAILSTATYWITMKYIFFLSFSAILLANAEIFTSELGFDVVEYLVSAKAYYWVAIGNPSHKMRTGRSPTLKND